MQYGNMGRRNRNGQYLVYWRCRNIGHNVNECPNPKAPKDYVPLCGQCGVQGHTTPQCQKTFSIVQQRPYPMEETPIAKVPN